MYKIMQVNNETVQSFCKHKIDAKVCDDQIVTYCTVCGKIFDVCLAVKNYNTVPVQISSGFINPIPEGIKPNNIGLYEPSVTSVNISKLDPNERGINKHYVDLDK